MNTPPTSQPMSGSWRRALEFKARLYENLVTGTINKEEYTDYKAKYTRGCGKCERKRSAL